MRVAIVTPRFGLKALGGAEYQARGFITETAARGWTSEVWTTCVEDLYSWKNVLPPGVEEVNGIRVRRFPARFVRPDRKAALDVQLGTTGFLSRDEQFEWLECGGHSPELYAHIRNHAHEFDAVVILPYALQLSHFAAWSAPEHVVLWPCLHDEPYAYMDSVRLLMESVWGVMFNSPEEGELAVDHLGMQIRRQYTLGEGVIESRPTPLASPPQPGYLLYTGRLEAGKNVPLLYEYVRRYADEGGDIHLKVIGRGPEMPPDHPAFDYVGAVSDGEKAAYLDRAMALCQPSLNESFSLVMMEAWLAGRPTLVHANCAVTVGHTGRSRAGLWFNSYDDFVGAYTWMQANPEKAEQMGRNGREYVRTNYSWATVVDRFAHQLAVWKTGAGHDMGAQVE